VRAVLLTHDPRDGRRNFDRDNVFWLVYDYGGGTFDAAVIHLLDGEFIVLRNSGDNHLGGKLIDW